MSGRRRRRPYRLMGAIRPPVCRQQRSDLAVAVLQWAPVGTARPLTIAGIGRTCIEAQACALSMVGLLVSYQRPGLS